LRFDLSSAGDPGKRRIIFLKPDTSVWKVDFISFADFVKASMISIARVSIKLTTFA
jgi:hypothetical protein